MKWVDTAEMVKKLRPDSEPTFGVNFSSTDQRWRVSRNDIADESKGWAIWFMAARPMRLADRVPLATAQQAMALAELLDLPIRGLAFALRVRAGWHAAVDVARGMINKRK